MTSPRAFVMLELMNAMVLVAKAAKARGYQIVALNHDPLRDSGPFAVPLGLVDEVVRVESWADTGRLNAVLKELVDRYDVVGTYSAFEAALPYEAALRELAGLPTSGAEHTRRMLDKGWVRRRLHAAGLSSLRSVSLEEALTWHSWQFDGGAVLKPVNGTGSALCFEVDSIVQLRTAAAQARKAQVVNPLMRDYILAHGGFVLEERAQGELMSVESIVVDHQVRLLGLTGRYLLAKDPVVEQGLFFPYEHPRLSEIAEKSASFHRRLGFAHGSTHLEVMVDPTGGIELIDFNPRFAGFASIVSFSEVFSVPFGSVLTDLACGALPDLAFTDRPTRYAAEMVVLPPPGVIELHDVEFPPGTIVPRLMKSRGQRLSGRADQLDAVGMFIVAGDTAADVHSRALLARRETKVNGEPLGDNPNNIVTFSDLIGRDSGKDRGRAAGDSKRGSQQS